jgi:hypothetical protein
MTGRSITAISDMIGHLFSSNPGPTQNDVDDWWHWWQMGDRVGRLLPLAAQPQLQLPLFPTNSLPQSPWQVLAVASAADLTLQFGGTGPAP